MKIGFFDSGLGGLVVLREVVRQLPQYDYVYYADTKHLPYGDKSESVIFELTKAALTSLFERGCLLIIVACNTASSETLRKLQDTYLQEHYPDRRVLGVIIPTIEELVTLAPTQAVLLATERTVQSGKYLLELKKLSSAISLETVAMRELVPLIEDHQHEAAASIALARLRDLGVREGEVVILGCTHYALLKESLRAALPGVHFISQDEIIPAKLEAYLVRHPELTSQLTQSGERSIQLTEHKDSYHRLAAEFLGGAYLPDE